MLDILNHWTIKSALSLRTVLTGTVLTGMLAGFVLTATPVASAQAMVTAQRGAAITPFAATTLLVPDWGQHDNIGFTAGVDYTRFLRSIVQPSLELRVTNANGLDVSERSYTGGVKVEAAFGRIHPYGTFLAGTGVITFTHPIPGYDSDTSFVYSLGGGAEFNVLPSWKVRADFSQQHWDLDPQLLTPVTLSVGVAYSIHFRGGGWEH